MYVYFFIFVYSSANTVGGAKFLNMLPPISGNASELAGDVEFAEVSTTHETNAAINYDPDAIEEQVNIINMLCKHL